MTATLSSLWRERVNWLRIPEYMREGLALYVEQGVRPGDFLWSVLVNDLRGACRHADNGNQRLIFDYVAWLYSFAPHDCWGSPDRAIAWLEHKGLQGMEVADVMDT